MNERGVKRVPDDDENRLRVKNDDGSVPLHRRVDKLEAQVEEHDDDIQQLKRDKSYVLGAAATVGILVGFLLALIGLLLTMKQT